MSSMLSKGIGAALLCCGLAAPAFAQTQLTISASSSSPQVGQTIGLDVMISNVLDLSAFQFSLNFDPSLLQANSSSEGSFLGSAGATFGTPGSIDNSIGTVSYAGYVLTGPVTPGASGSGVLIHMSFTALAAGTATLSFADTIFLNTQSNDIAVTLQSGTVMVTAVPEPASLGLMLAGLGLVAWRRRSVAAAA